MSGDLLKAKELLKSNGFTCVLCRDECTVTSTERGIKPLMGLLDGGKSFDGFSAADKIVGRAAAFLYVLLGVREVYAQVLSENAAVIFEKYGIGFSYGVLTEEIINRKGTGLCPMELTVKDISEPEKALEMLKKKLQSME